jgi:putative tRNA adenosine deaminase-associated protein
LPYFAAALARRGTSWTGEEIDLSEVEDLDGVVDVVRQSAGDDADVTLLLFEQDDEWFAVLRLDDDTDPRVFVSDARVVETSAVGSILGEAAVDEELDTDDDEEGDEEDDDEAGGPAGEPVGDVDLLTDLGTSSDRLLELCAEEGQLPGDILSAVCEGAGCLEVFEQLREG